MQTVNDRARSPTALLILAAMMPGCVHEQLVTSPAEVRAHVRELRQQQHAAVWATGQDGSSVSRPVRITPDHQVTVDLVEHGTVRRVELSVAALIEQCPDDPATEASAACRLAHASPLPTIVVERGADSGAVVGGVVLTGVYVGALGGLAYCAFACDDHLAAGIGAGALFVGGLVVYALTDGLHSLFSSKPKLDR